ncbi:MAG: glycosyltransferase family 4 protein [Pseudomonadota bacterium]
MRGTGQERGLEIHVLANTWEAGWGPVQFHKIPAITFPRFLRPVSFASLVQHIVKKEDYTIVHSHERIFSMDVFTVHGIPHETWIREARRKPLSLFDKTTAWVEARGLKGPKIPMILPVSGMVKEEILRLYDIPKSKIQVIHPGISPDLFSRPDQDRWRVEVRRRHGLSPEDLVVLFVGMNFEMKRLDLVLEGVAPLASGNKRGPSLKVLVVGRGNTKKYEALSERLGIRNRCVFAGVTQEVEKYYAASDVFAMPSRFDTFGMAVLEAMAAGLPVIISRQVGARDLVTDGVSGFILNGDPSFGLCKSPCSLSEPRNATESGRDGDATAVIPEKCSGV